MDLTEQIESYLAVKDYSISTQRAQRSILNDFNTWQMHQPRIKMADKATGYQLFIRDNCFRKPKTIEKQIGVVRRFCSWLEETGRVDAFKLDEQLLGRPEMKTVPSPSIGPEEVVQILYTMSNCNNIQIALRDSAMLVLAVVCGLTANEIASLKISAFGNLRNGKDLYYCNTLIELPRVVSVLLTWYTRDRRAVYGNEPLFLLEDGNDSKGLSASMVKERISELLSIVGCTYEEAVPGDCQLRIAQYFKILDESERRIAATSIQKLAFEDSKMPHGYLSNLREKYFGDRLLCCEVPRHKTFEAMG